MWIFYDPWVVFYNIENLVSKATVFFHTHIQEYSGSWYYFLIDQTDLSTYMGELGTLERHSEKWLSSPSIVWYCMCTHDSSSNASVVLREYPYIVVALLRRIDKLENKQTSQYDTQTIIMKL